MSRVLSVCCMWSSFWIISWYPLCVGIISGIATICPLDVLQFLCCQYFSGVCHSFSQPLFHIMGPGVAKWLRLCATSRKVPGSIPGGVTGFFSDIFPSDWTMALGSTQPLVKMSTRNIPGGKGGRCVRLTTYHHTVPLSRNLGALTS